MVRPGPDSTHDQGSSKRVALVTGAGRGMGRGIATALGQVGWDVVVNYLNNAAAAEETVAKIMDAGGEAMAVKADVADPGQREQLLDQVMASYGRIDLLVNN